MSAPTDLPDRLTGLGARGQPTPLPEHERAVPFARPDPLTMCVQRAPDGPTVFQRDTVGLWTWFIDDEAEDRAFVERALLAGCPVFSTMAEVIAWARDVGPASIDSSRGG